MTEVMQEMAVTTCGTCGSQLVNEVCLNADCTEAQIVASAAADRATAKATARTGQVVATRTDAAASERPRSFASSGRPD